MCGTEEQVMNGSSYAKMVFMDSIEQENLKSIGVMGCKIIMEVLNWWVHFK